MIETKYELISPSGNSMGIFVTAQEAASTAGSFWPGVGNGSDGWSIRLVGADVVHQRSNLGPVKV